MSPNEPYRMTGLLRCLGTRKNNAHLTRTSQIHAPFSTAPWSPEEQANQMLARYRRRCTSWVMPRSGRARRRLPSASCAPDTTQLTRASPPWRSPRCPRRAPPRHRLRSEGPRPQHTAGRRGLHAPSSPALLCSFPLLLDSG